MTSPRFAHTGVTHPLCMSGSWPGRSPCRMWNSYRTDVTSPARIGCRSSSNPYYVHGVYARKGVESNRALAGPVTGPRHDGRAMGPRVRPEASLSKAKAGNHRGLDFVVSVYPLIRRALRILLPNTAPATSNRSDTSFRFLSLLDGIETFVASVLTFLWD